MKHVWNHLDCCLAIKQFNWHTIESKSIPRCNKGAKNTHSSIHLHTHTAFTSYHISYLSYKIIIQTVPLALCGSWTPFRGFQHVMGTMGSRKLQTPFKTHLQRCDHRSFELLRDQLQPSNNTRIWPRIFPVFSARSGYNSTVISCDRYPS